MHSFINQLPQAHRAFKKPMHSANKQILHLTRPERIHGLLQCEGQSHLILICHSIAVAVADEQANACA
eukprot:1161149-Pelagomonas_calceolata.AAC.3